MEKPGGDKHGETLDGPVGDVAAFEHQRVAGAVRTDFILSAEIMAIALAEVSGQGLIARDHPRDRRHSHHHRGLWRGGRDREDGRYRPASRPAAGRGGDDATVGRMLVAAMPRVMWLLATVGTAAMLWVGGGILLHGADELGLHHPAALAHGIQHAVQAGVGQGCRRRCRLAGLPVWRWSGWSWARCSRWWSISAPCAAARGLIGPRGTPQQAAAACAALPGRWRWGAGLSQRVAGNQFGESILAQWRREFESGRHRFGPDDESRGRGLIGQEQRQPFADVQFGDARDTGAMGCQVLKHGR
jgi:hypothetical protein